MTTTPPPAGILQRVLRAVLPHALVDRLLGEDAADARAREEMDLHIALETERLVQGGTAESEARRQALATFGGLTRYAEEMRDGRRSAWRDALARDVRHARRALARAPGFTASAAGVLALGLGANAAIFSLLSATLLRPLPFPEADRLVVVSQAVSGITTTGDRRWSYPEFRALREALTTVAPLTAVATSDVNLSGRGTALRVRTEVVSPDYFGVLRVQPHAGGVFDPSDATAAAGPRAVLGHHLWTRHFAADPAIVGSEVGLNGVRHTVLGVAPPGFDGLTGDADVWIPHAVAPDVTYSGHLTTGQHFLTVVGRLAPGRTLDEARAEVASAGAAAAASARHAAGGPTDGVWTASAARLEDARRHPATMRVHLALSAVALIVLVLAVINVSGLLLARALGRHREFAVRAALGAHGRQLVRQVLAESSLVGLAGGVVGLAVAGTLLWAAGDTLQAMLRMPLAGPGSGVQAFAAPSLDWRVCLFAVVLSVVSGAAAGLVAAFRTAGAGRTVDITLARGASEAAAGTRGGAAWLSAVVALQMTGAFALLVSAGTLLQALDSLVNRDMGVRPSGVVTFWISPPESRYGGDAAARLIEQVLERIEALPVVDGASVGRCAPLVPCSWTSVHVANTPAASAQRFAGRHYVAPSHFEVLGIPLLRGRPLSRDDRAGTPLVGVINVSGARVLWPGEDPLGKQVRFGSGGRFADEGAWTTIVGVVGDVPYERSGRVGVDVYTSYRQFTWAEAMLLVRTRQDPLSIVADLRGAVASVDRDLSIHDVRTLSARTGGAVAPERFATLAVASFAVLGLLLASLGVYGVTTYIVARRRREIGIRMALGATRLRVLRLIARRATSLVLCGLALGVVAAGVLARPLTLLVPEATTLSPALMLPAGLLLVVSALLATLVPAWSATRVSPAVTLTEE